MFLQFCVNCFQSISQSVVFTETSPSEPLVCLFNMCLVPTSHPLSTASDYLEEEPRNWVFEQSPFSPGGYNAGKQTFQHDLPHSFPIMSFFSISPFCISFLPFSRGSVSQCKTVLLGPTLLYPASDFIRSHLTERTRPVLSHLTQSERGPQVFHS